MSTANYKFLRFISKNDRVVTGVLLGWILWLKPMLRRAQAPLQERLITFLTAAVHHKAIRL